MSSFDPVEKSWKGPTVPLHDVGGLNLGELILQSLAETPEKVLQISASDDKPLTCQELKVAAIRVAQNLAKIGVKPDDVVGIIAPQSHFTTSLIIGCIISGAVISPLHETLSDSDIVTVYSQTKPKIIVAESSFIPQLQRALKNVNFHYRIYSTAAESSLFMRASNLVKPTGKEDEFVAPKFLKPNADKLFVIMCSSGTTGPPKGVSIAHSFLTLSLPLLKLFSTGEATSTYCPSPIYWSTGFNQNLIHIFSNELRILPSGKPFTAEEFLGLVEKYSISSSIIAPSNLNSVLNCETLSSYNLDSLKRITSGGSVISKTIRDKFAATFPDKDLQIPYGMTESGAAVPKPGEYKLEYCAGSVILPNTEIKIVDDDGHRLSVDERGEIRIKSSFKFQGYYNNPKATRDAVDDEGFFISGDIGYFNEEGMLFVVDRKKDVLKSMSMQVNLSEIESIVQTIEGVDLVSVVGIPDDIYINLLAAAVVKRSGFEKLREKDIVDHLAGIAPDYKQLHGGVYFFDKLPTTPSGKIQRRFVLEEVVKARKM